MVCAHGLFCNIHLSKVLIWSHLKELSETLQTCRLLYKSYLLYVRVGLLYLYQSNLYLFIIFYLFSVFLKSPYEDMPLWLCFLQDGILTQGKQRLILCIFSFKEDSFCVFCVYWLTNNCYPNDLNWHAMQLWVYWQIRQGSFKSGGLIYCFYYDCISPSSVHSFKTFFTWRKWKSLSLATTRSSQIRVKVAV